MALSKSPFDFFSAFTAVARETLVWPITSSMSLGSTPVSSTASSSSPLASLASAPPAAWPSSAPASTSSGRSSSPKSFWPMPLALNCSAAFSASLEFMSSILASPNTTYVSEDGLLNTSGREMTNITPFTCLMVTRVMSGTGFRPRRRIALRAFFSPRLCFLRCSPAPPAAAAASPSSSPSASGTASSSSASSILTAGDSSSGTSSILGVTSAILGPR
mmetsp:Transcript_13803/g.39246  ORF Transcript_13803/g.39246 Transcript_13803/m.39246 type:complete len:218 (-) Transcript_13803:144-797(-)